jgi:hypothetical protein
MKRIYTLLLLVMSLILMAQSWEYNSNKNPFNNSNREIYDQENKKSEREINQEMNNVKTAIKKSEAIYNFFQNDSNEVQNQDEEQNASGPGAPGEPVSIDNQLIILFSAAIGIFLLYFRKSTTRKHFNY